MTFKTTKRCCYVGYIVQALAINFLPLLFVMFHNIYGFSYALIGTLVSVNFISQLLLDICSVFFIDKIGHKQSAVTSQLLCSIGFVLIALLPDVMPPYIGLCIGVVICSVGAGLIEVVINPIVTGLPKEYEGNIVLTHSFYCWGQLSVILATTVALRIFGEGSWKLISCFWALIPLINALVFIKAPVAPQIEEGKRKSIFSLVRNKAFIAMLLIMICAGGSELAMAQWASTFAQSALGVDKVLGDILGPCLFAFTMGIGRLVYGLFQKRLNYKLYSICSCLLCVLCYACAAIAKNPYLSLAGCALCGFSVSTFWPGTVELASERFPDGSGAMYSAIAIFGDIGCSLAPFITGVIASIGALGKNALRAGMLVNIVYPIAFILLISGLVKKENK